MMFEAEALAMEASSMAEYGEGKALRVEDAFNRFLDASLWLSTIPDVVQP